MSLNKDDSPVPMVNVKLLKRCLSSKTIISYGHGLCARAWNDSISLLLSEVPAPFDLITHIFSTGTIQSPAEMLPVHLQETY